MNENRDPMESLIDAEIDQAFRAMPLEEPPTRLAQAVLDQVRGQIPQPRFALQWSDYFAAAFTASMLGAGFITLQTLPPVFGMALRADFLYYLYRLELIAPRPWLWAGIAAVSLACLWTGAFVLRYSRTRPAKLPQPSPSQLP